MLYGANYRLIKEEEKKSVWLVALSLKTAVEIQTNFLQISAPFKPNLKCLHSLFSIYFSFVFNCMIAHSQIAHFCMFS